MTVFDRRMPDGSRHFATVPLRAAQRDTVGRSLRRLAKRLAGARILADSGDASGSGRIELRYRRHVFRMHWREDTLRISVEDPGCPEPIVVEVAGHFRALARRRRRPAQDGPDASASDAAPTEARRPNGDEATPASLTAVLDALRRMCAERA